MTDPCNDPDDFAYCLSRFYDGDLDLDELVEYRQAVINQFEEGSRYCPDSQWARWVKNHERDLEEIAEEMVRVEKLARIEKTDKFLKELHNV
jgi:hypothetical protein